MVHRVPEPMGPVEQGEGDEPQLTAEALAERIGESLSTDDDA